jgi:hypothetical protein
MKRKKWTPQAEVSDSLLRFREKRKWQIALRRYVLLQNQSSFYAPYFGLDIRSLRKWIEIQFDNEMSWDTFSKTWQFDHLIPVIHFDFQNEDDLRLCWNFTNIGVEKLTEGKTRTPRVDALAVKSHFKALYEQTGYPVCLQMVKKIERIEEEQQLLKDPLEEFIKENQSYLSTIAGFSSYEYESLNEGIELGQIIAEREFVNKITR